MQIGTLPLDNPLILAPMAGITELPLRRLAKEHGCALVVTELISSNGLVQGGQKSLELLKSHPAEKPLSVQIFGKDPQMMKEAARLVVDLGADLVDINMGCSVRKVVRQGAGAALMREPRLLERILKAVRAAIDVPLTIKIRSGWDASGDEALKVGQIAEDCGVDALAVHPRTALQGFGGTADWSLIGRLKERLSMPVIGNGDVVSGGDVVRMQSLTGCDAVMIGRAAQGNPWIFSQSLDVMDGREPAVPDLPERLEVVRRYVDYMVDHFGEVRAVRMLRSRIVWFVKGLPGCSAFRNTVTRLESRQEMIDAVHAYFHSIRL